MPANLLILPLLAGFWFLHHCHRYRFRALHWDGYRLLLESAVHGFIFLSVARGLIIGLKLIHGVPPLIDNYWRPIARIDYLGSGIGSFLLAGTVSFLDNRCLTPFRSRDLFESYRESRAERRGVWRSVLDAIATAYSLNSEESSAKAVEDFGNPLVRLLDSAARGGTAVSITLKNRKWYVGFVSEAISLDPRQTHFRLTPLFSGFRNKDTLSATPELSYSALYVGIQRMQAASLQPKDFDITIPIGDIEIANYFREDYYLRYFANSDAKTIVQSGRDDDPPAEYENPAINIG